MPCFSMRAMRSASVSSWGGLVSPSTISTVLGWKWEPLSYTGRVYREQKRQSNHCATALSKRQLPVRGTCPRLCNDRLCNGSRVGPQLSSRPLPTEAHGCLTAPMIYHLVTPAVIWVHIQIVSGQNHKTMGHKAFPRDVNLHRSLLPLSILGAAS